MDVFAENLEVLAPILWAAATRARFDGAPHNHRRAAAARVAALAPPEPAWEGPLGDWTELEQVIRTDRPLARPATYHAYLDAAGRIAADTLWDTLLGTFWEVATPGDDVRLLDLGGGVGTYSHAFLRRNPRWSSTLVEVPEVAAQVPESPRLRVVPHPFTDASDVGDGNIVLLSNFLHMHGPDTARSLAAAAARRLRSGGRLVVKDFDPATVVGAYFDLSLALYLDEGRLHPPPQVTSWLEAAGLAVTQRQLGPAYVLIGSAQP